MDEAAPVNISENNKQHLDLLLIILLALIAIACAFILSGGNAVRVIMTIPLLIFYPGYAMVSALWPENERDGKGIDTIGRIAMSIGLSIAIMSVIGLMLSFTVGLTITSVLLGNLAVLLSWTFIALFRRGRLPASKQFSPDLFRWPGSPFINGSEKAVATLIVASIVICSGFVAYAIFKPANAATYSEIYLLDSNRTTQNYPLNITANETATVILGIANHEQSVIDYVVLVGIENATSHVFINDWNNTNLLSQTTVFVRNVSLDNDALFEDTFAFYFSEPGEYKVIWELQFADNDSKYQVHLWIRVNST